MYQEFYHNTIQSNYIKYLLQNNYIPTVPFTSNLNHITKGCTYIHDGYFVKAKVSQDINEIRENLKKEEENYSQYFERYEPYIFGRQYPGLTTNYTSNTDMYDPETHFYLGQYLKAYKACYGVDLFQYYNCFSDEYLTNIDLIKNDNMPFVTIQEKPDVNYKILSVPISLCQEYTIAIDCSTEVIMCPAFVGKKGILKEQTAILQSALLVAPHPNVHQKSNYIHTQTNFNNPIYYFSPCIPGNYDNAQLTLPQYEKYLRLLIKLPVSNKSSVTILQGHYKNVKEQQEKLINLSLEDVKKEFKDLIQFDYNSSNSDGYTIAKDTILNHYGNLENIVTTYPKLNSTDNPTTEKLLNYSFNVLKYNDNTNNNTNILDINYNVTFSDYNIFKENIDYQLPTPILNPENIELPISFSDLKSKMPDILKNFNVYPNGIKFEYMINGDIWTDENNNNKIESLTPLRIRAKGGTYEDLYYCKNSSWGDITTNDNVSTTSPSFAYYNCTSLIKEGIYQIKLSGDNDIKKEFDILIDDKGIREYYGIDYNINDDEWSLPIYIEVERTAVIKIPWGVSFDIISKDLLISYKFSNNDNNDDTLNLFNIKCSNFNLVSDQAYINTIISDKNNYSVKIIKEGNYYFNYMDWIEFKESIESESNINNYLNNYLYNLLSLLYINDQNSYAFTPRLFEYLVNNVIIKSNQFPQNIKNIQKYLNNLNNNIAEDGIWSDNLRIGVFKAVNKYRNILKLPKIKDINGFVDKNSEQILKNYYNYINARKNINN